MNGVCKQNVYVRACMHVHTQTHILKQPEEQLKNSKQVVVFRLSLGQIIIASAFKSAVLL